MTDDFRRELERSPFPGLRFAPAIKARIIGVNWHEWDRNADPQIWPENEPEDYIWEMPHDPAVAAQMQDTWELLPQLVPLRTERIEKTNRSPERLRVFSNEPHLPSLFISRHEYGDLIVDRAAREWFETRVAEWVEFMEVVMVAAEE